MTEAPDGYSIGVRTHEGFFQCLAEAAENHPDWTSYRWVEYQPCEGKVLVKKEVKASAWIRQFIWNVLPYEPDENDYIAQAQEDKYFLLALKSPVA